MSGQDAERGIRNEERLNANDARWVAHEEAQRQSWVAHLTVHDLEAKALQHQFALDSEHFAALNHEATRIAADKATYLPRELYEQGQREVMRRSELLASAASTFVTRDVFDAEIGARDATIDALVTWKNRATGGFAVLTLVSGAVGAAIVKVLGG